MSTSDLNSYLSVKFVTVITATGGHLGGGVAGYMNRVFLFLLTILLDKHFKIDLQYLDPRISLGLN
jgi:hypothetical protein